MGSLLRLPAPGVWLGQKQNGIIYIFGTSVAIKGIPGGWLEPLSLLGLFSRVAHLTWCKAPREQKKSLPGSGGT